MRQRRERLPMPVPRGAPPPQLLLAGERVSEQPLRARELHRRPGRVSSRPRPLTAPRWSGTGAETWLKSQVCLPRPPPAPPPGTEQMGEEEGLPAWVGRAGSPRAGFALGSPVLPAGCSSGGCPLNLAHLKCSPVPVRDQCAPLPQSPSRLPLDVALVKWPQSARPAELCEVLVGNFLEPQTVA